METGHHQPTAASTWHAIAGAAITGSLLEWPPDLFALTNLILSRTEAFRFSVPAAPGWPPGATRQWAEAVEEAGRDWGACVEDRELAMPELLASEWDAFNECLEAPLERLAEGREAEMRKALLTLHAIADEACAGLAVALDSSQGDGCMYRARGREMLARTGSLSRINPQVLRVLPKVRTPPTGRPAFSRYACVLGPGIEAHWHKAPARHRGTDPSSEFATLLLLPWPLEVRESDFHALDGSVQRLEKEPYGFYEFAPSDGLDFDLMDRVLSAARKEANSVDVVVLPESAVAEDEIPEVEALLHDHGVVMALAGVRGRPREPGRLPENWLHIGVNATLEKGARSPGQGDGAWMRIRQNKHHRWSLDESQVYQYHLGGVLHPHIRWWEAMELPRRAVEFVEVAELTAACLVCEDLAQNDDIGGLLRLVGPTVVFALLLDGPQLSSRWAARYASVLADDPGSAVLTLSSFGMVQRSRPHSHEASRVVALWKDSSGGVREIPLETGAHAVLLTVCMDRATRRSADGRWPVDNGTTCFQVATQQIRASGEVSSAGSARSTSPIHGLLESGDLTVLTAWAEAVSEILESRADRIEGLFAEAGAGASWRSDLGLPEPSRELCRALDSLEELVRSAESPGAPPSFEGVLRVAEQEREEDAGLDGLVRRALLSTLEQRLTRRLHAPIV
jgi:hypothetical protein